MFDPSTAALIRRLPAFEGLNPERLPEALTEAFAGIVSARLRLQSDGDAARAELSRITDHYRRVGNALETLAALSAEGPVRTSAAYVAAQAHRLVSLATCSLNPNEAGSLLLTAEGVSPDISAMILFMIADQPADAFAVAEELQSLIGDDASLENTLCRALVRIVRGQPIHDLQPDGVNEDESTDLLRAAPRHLYRKVLDGVTLLGEHYTSRIAVDPAGQARALFSAVKEDSVTRVSFGRNAPPELARSFLFSSFNGPHHLASLLESAAGSVAEMALIRVPPPAGMDATAWENAIAPIARGRPYLWQNHREAIRQGMLDPGVSSVMTFPTGSGKSTLSELKVAATLARGRDVLFLAPTHALVFQVRSNFSVLFGGSAVSTSLPADDYYAELDSRDAKIAVMTPERCLAMMAMRPMAFQALGLIVFDECHLLHPNELGFSRRNLDAMLLVLNLFNSAPAADWLLISAMVANGATLAEWIQEQTGRKCLPLLLDWKPTRQARGCLAFERKAVEKLEKFLATKANEVRLPGGAVPHPGVAIQRELSAQPLGFFCLQHNWQTQERED